MKKITSVAALCLRLTWRSVVGLFILLGAVQWFAFSTLGAEEFGWRSFEYRLGNWFSAIGYIGIYLLAGVLFVSLSGSKKSKIAYTLRRLQIPECGITAVCALVIAGYFVTYWAFQLVLVLGCFFHYAAAMEPGHNALFLAAFRATCFHNLLPLEEPWALARNIVLAVSIGSGLALGAQNTRNGRPAPLLMTLMTGFFCMVLMPHQMASAGTDTALSVIAVVCMLIDWIWTWRWMRNEAN